MKVLTEQSVEMMTTAYKDDVGLRFFIERHSNAGTTDCRSGFRAAANSETTFVRREANVKYNFVRRTSAATNGSAAPLEMELVGDAGSTPTKRLTAEQLVPYEMLLAGKSADAIEGYRKIFKETPRNVPVSEDRLNNWS